MRLRCSQVLVGQYSLIVWMINFLDDNEELSNACKSKAKWLLFIMTFCATLACALPSNNTLMMIAASEVGERAIKSEAVSTIVDPSVELLKTWIAKETKNLKESASK